MKVSHSVVLFMNLSTVSKNTILCMYQTCFCAIFCHQMGQARSGLMPFLSYKHPKTITESAFRKHFSGLNTRPFTQAWSMRHLMFLSSCSSVTPWTIISLAIDTTPSRPSRIWSILAWKASWLSMEP